MTLNDIFTSNGKVYGKHWKIFKTTDEWNHIKLSQEHKNLSSDLEILYCYVNNTIPRTCSCGNRLKFHFYHNPYITRTCSTQCANKDPDNRELKRQTNIRKYGCDNPLKNEKIRRKRKNTMILKYGSEHALCNDTILEQTKLKNKVTRYGKINKKLLDKTWLENEYNIKSQTLLAKEIGVSQSTVGLYLKKHDISTSIHAYRSSIEKAIIDFLTSYNIETVSSSRTIIPPKEIDIFIPSHNLAIEVDGLYWHSVLNKEDDTPENQNYHLDKTKTCQEKGVQLLHFTDQEWNEKKDIVKSMILAKLHLNSKIYARKCTIIDVSNNDGRQFVQNNHIQGSCIGGAYKGLTCDGEIVAVMQIGKSRFNKNYEFELLRFCSKLGTNVVGGFSRLLKAFNLNGSLVSYANRRFSEGAVYEKCGFTLSHESGPNYYYWDKDNYYMQSRHQFQKHRLKTRLAFFDENLTESENMFKNDYGKFYDCGNLVFTYL